LVKVVRNEAFLKPVFAVVVAFALISVPNSGCLNARSSEISQPAASAAVDPPDSTASVVGEGAASVETVHGQIVSVDRDKKLVTLQTPGGKPVTVHVYNPYNLAAAKPGEPFVAKFYEIATISKLQPGQSPPRPSLTQGIVSAAPGQTPGAAIGSQLQFAVTVAAIDKKDKAISIKGPDGAVEVVNVANPEALDQVQAGEDIAVTLTDAVVVKLDKEPASATNAAPLIDPEAREVLSRACRLLSSARTVTYHAEITFDSVLPSGVKLQYAAAMDTAIKRPDHLAISYKSDLGAKAVWYNGETLTILDPAKRAYATVALPGTIDVMFQKVADEQNLSLPLEGLDYNNLCGRAYRDIQRGKYVGVNDVAGVDCDHLAFIQQQADWQLWVDHGKRPLPRKIVITYKKLPAQPQWVAVLSDWRLNQPLSASIFQPRIPKGTIKTSFIGTQEKTQ
jgi:hypothetical protein